MNVDKLLATDDKTHADISCRMPIDDEATALEKEKEKYFKQAGGVSTTAQHDGYHHEGDTAFEIFPVDAENHTGIVPITNEEATEAAAAHGDVLIPIPSTDMLFTFFCSQRTKER